MLTKLKKQGLRNKMKLAMFFLALPVMGLAGLSSAFLGEAKAEQQCDAAIDFVRSDIENRLGGKVQEIFRRESSNSPFSDAREEIIIELDANMERGGGLKYRRATVSQVNVNDNVANSKALSLSYADKVIRSCKGIARFGLGLYENRPYFSLQENNQIIPDSCNFTNSQAWGEQICS